MWLKWLPWKYIVRRLARSHGFSDPIALLSHIRRFSQPSEVNEPIELLRAGVVLHARGLINSRVIQHNLDWVWPYWVNKQFKPQSKAFIPRAFSLTHINLSARNWTSIGLPGFAVYPIVDPRGLVMPFWDGWSIDTWIISEQGELLAPSRLERNVEQEYNLNHNLSVVTVSKNEIFYLSNKAEVNLIDNDCVCSINLLTTSKLPAWLVISIRPYNPEGVSFIHKIEFYKEDIRWRINEKHNVFLNEQPDKYVMSDYRSGDVALKLQFLENEKAKTTCDVGMATAAAMYKLEPEQQRIVKVEIPLNKERSKVSNSFCHKLPDNNYWRDILEGSCRISLPYKNYQFLHEAAVRSVVLHSPAEVYPGPFTYKRFWFRDATFIIYSMLCIGMIERAEKLIDNFFSRQTAFGYFHSQQGEWDSNGQVLWLMNKFCQFTGRKPKSGWHRPIINAAKWIIRKRISRDSKKPHTGLLPAGFSAEHLGPNDYYYWDDFWSVAGLQAAAQMVEGTRYENKTTEFIYEAGDLLEAVESSLALCQERLGRPAIPASPYRRLDSGMIGSLAACYPLDIFKPDDERVRDTTSYLMQNCIVNNAFFHDISHSGINPYLTLQLAQVLIRIEDLRFIELIESVAELASPTGQWPEAINPRTGLGSMGDGQHVWASAEWIIIMINSFIMQQGKKIVIGAGVFPDWLAKNNKISIGPVMTAWGDMTVELLIDEENVTVKWEGHWRSNRPEIEVRLPGFEHVTADLYQTSVELKRMIKE
jgi:hypothetical protein